MKPAPFEYHAPTSLDEAVALLSKLENAKVIAGGQSLVAMMNFRYAMPDHLVDLGNVAGLAGLHFDAHGLRIGAMTRQRELEFSAALAGKAPLFKAALAHVGHRQTRNRGTLGAVWPMRIPRPNCRPFVWRLMPRSKSSEPTARAASRCGNSPPAS